MMNSGSVDGQNLDEIWGISGQTLLESVWNDLITTDRINQYILISPLWYIKHQNPRIEVYI